VGVVQVSEAHYAKHQPSLRSDAKETCIIAGRRSLAFGRISIAIVSRAARCLRSAALRINIVPRFGRLTRGLPVVRLKLALKE
jgi:hypothetical protein